MTLTKISIFISINYLHLIDLNNLWNVALLINPHRISNITFKPWVQVEFDNFDFQHWKSFNVHTQFECCIFKSNLC